jgi:hypothetical protein
LLDAGDYVKHRTILGKPRIRAAAQAHGSEALFDARGAASSFAPRGYELEGAA